MSSYPPEQPPMRYSVLAGHEVSTWSEEWKHECEIAYLAALPTAKQLACLDGTSESRGMKQIRGEAAVVRLRAEINRYAESKRAKA